MLGVTKPVPEPRIEPPTATPYQLSVPALAVAPKVTLPVPQRPAAVVVITVGVTVTEAITGTRVEIQLPFAVST